MKPEYAQRNGRLNSSFIFKNTSKNGTGNLALRLYEGREFTHVNIKKNESF